MLYTALRFVLLKHNMVHRTFICVLKRSSNVIIDTIHSDNGSIFNFCFYHLDTWCTIKRGRRKGQEHQPPQSDDLVWWSKQRALCRSHSARHPKEIQLCILDVNSLLAELHPIDTQNLWCEENHAIVRNIKSQTFNWPNKDPGVGGSWWTHSCTATGCRPSCLPPLPPLNSLL